MSCTQCPPEQECLWVHGKRSTYNNHKCRCTPCKTATSIYKSNYRKTRTQPPRPSRKRPGKASEFVLDPLKVWKPIPGLPSRFRASSEGDIASLPYRVSFLELRNGVETPVDRLVDGRMLKQRVSRRNQFKGQIVVGIYSGKGRENSRAVEHRVAILVARAFHGVPYPLGDKVEANKWRIRFKDGDLFNVSAANIEWVASFGGTDGQQRRYEAALDAWEERRMEPVSSWAARIFGEDAA